jgi:Bifunctional DNA primase/polymerase, N-terminal/AAA domain
LNTSNSSISSQATASSYKSISESLRAVGLWCFPIRFKLGENLKVEKLPLIGWKEFQQRPPSQAELDEWYAEFANAKSAAIPTGPGTGIVVLDADNEDEIEYLEKRGMDETWLVRTRRGLHYYYRFPIDVKVHNSAGALASGVDVRGIGGMVVAAGSQYQYFEIIDNVSKPRTFTYSWEPGHSPADLPLAAPSEWVLSWLRDEAERRTPAASPAPAQPYLGSISAWARTAYEAELETLRFAEPGRRNDTSCRVAFRLGQLCGGGELDEAEIMAALHGVANSWPNATHTIDTMNRAFKAGRAQPRCAPPRRDYSPPVGLKIEIKNDCVMRNDNRTEDETREGTAPRRFQIEWLHHRRIPLREYTLFVRDPDTGGTNVLVDAAARVSAGMPFPCDSTRIQGRVLVVTSKWKRVFEPRLFVNDANMDCVNHLELNKSLDELERDLRKLRDVRLLILHRIVDYFIALGIDINKDIEVRPALKRLLSLADELNFTILSSANMNKLATFKPKYRVQGAIGFVEEASAVWVIVPDPEQLERRLVLNLTNSLAPPGNYNSAFTTHNQDGFPRLRWDIERVNVAVGSVIGGFSDGRGPKPVKTEIVKRMLRQILGDGKEHPDHEVKALINAAGISNSLIQSVSKDYVDKREVGKSGLRLWKLK